MRVFLKIIFVQLIFNLYVFLRGWQVLPQSKWVRTPYALLFGIELILYLVGFLGIGSLPDYLLHPIAWMGTTWMVFIVYMTALLLMYDGVRYTLKKIKKEKGKLYTLRARRLYYACSVVLVVGVMIYGNHKFYNPSIVNVDIEVDKPAGDIDQMRIAVLSDVHVGTLINKEILSGYVDLVMEQKPDMILLVGDIIDYTLAPAVEQRMDEEFKRLQAPYGVYASTGNHEYIDVDDEPRAKIKWLRDESGLTLLQDTAIKINDAFYLLGREDDKCPERKPLGDIVQGIDTSLPLIVMKHQPHRLYEEVDNGADIAVCGHTHNGQLFPANIFVKFMYEVGYGYKKKENTHIYVSSGIGLAGPQYRIGTQSEIVILNVKFRKR